MSEADLTKWNDRYRAGSYSNRTHPTRLLEQHLSNFRRGRALDVACGAGRNALYLASEGFDVDAIDISDIALQRASETARSRKLSVNWIAADLDSGLGTCAEVADSYALIVCVRYVNLPLISELIELLADGGVFLCEQHLRTTEEVAGPKSERFRLRPNELLQTATPLTVKLYREGIVQDPDDRRVALAQLIATKGEETELIYC